MNREEIQRAIVFVTDKKRMLESCNKDPFMPGFARDMNSADIAVYSTILDCLKIVSGS